MKSILASLLAVIVFVGVARSGEKPAAALPMNQAIAQSPKNASVSVVFTSWAMDGGSILNDIRFSDGRLYRLSLDYPVELMTDKLVHQRIHFTIYAEDPDRIRPEVLDHGSTAERRLIELLEKRISTTSNTHEKKNSTSLVSFLKDRDQPFPEAHSGKWDLTPRPPVNLDFRNQPKKKDGK